MDELGRALSRLPESQQSQFVEGTRNLLTQDGSQVGRAHARVLDNIGQSNPTHMNNLLGQFTDAQLNGLVDQGVLNTPSGIAGYNSDSQAIRNIMGNMQNVSPELQARMFRAVNKGADSMANIGRTLLRNGGIAAGSGLALHNSAKDLVNDSARFLTGPNGQNVMDQLRTQDPNATQLQNFFANTIELNRTGGEIAPEARNNLRQIADSLNSVENGRYFTQGLINGIGELNGRLDREGQILNAAFGALGGLGGSVIPGAGKAAGAAVFGGAAAIGSDQLIRFLQNPTREAYSQLQQELLSNP